MFNAINSTNPFTLSVYLIQKYIVINIFAKYRHNTKTIGSINSTLCHILMTSWSRLLVLCYRKYQQGYSCIATLVPCCRRGYATTGKRHARITPRGQQSTLHLRHVAASLIPR